MRATDFDFLRRKEILLIIILLISMSFFQITLNNFGVNKSSVNPFFELDNSILELFGVILPFLAILYVIFQHSSKKVYSWLPPRRYFLIVFFVFLLLAFFPLFSFLNDIVEEENPINNSSSSNTVPASNPNPDPTGIPNNAVSSNSILFSQFLEEFRYLGILCLLLLPFILLYFSQKKSKSQEDEEVSSTEEEEQVNKRSNLYRTKTILECYYQSSEVLENRGADNSRSITPTEFSLDVIEKKLSIPTAISNLTFLFEEAKFSSHKMSDKQVEEAKIITSNIIYELNQDQIKEKKIDNEFGITQERK